MSHHDKDKDKGKSDGNPNPGANPRDAEVTRDAGRAGTYDEKL